MPNILAIDRSANGGSFAIAAGGREPVAENFAETAPRSPEWFPQLVSAMADAGVELRSLDTIVVGTGPGSFSGIRAVLAAAQGLALPLSIPVFGVLSSSALAFSVHRRSGAARVAVAGDARRGSIWLADHDFSDGRGLESAAPRLIPYAGAAESLRALGGAAIVSPDAARVRAALLAAGDGGIEIAQAAPDAADVAAFYLAHPESAVRDPVPAYLHPAVDPKKA